MKQNFSKRMGLKPPRVLQVESMDEDLRNSLFNCFYENLWQGASDSYQEELLTEIFNKYFKQPMYRFGIEEHFFNPEEEVMNFFLRRASWNEIYDFIEFLFESSVIPSFLPEFLGDFAQFCNIVLEQEMAGYRIVNGLVVPIVNEIEIEGIQEALHSPNEYANEHLQKALRFLSDRESPDFQNSVKESISAVESICRTMVKAKSLGDALKTIEKNVSMQPCFKNGLEQLYAYTNGKNGIRHALLEQSQVTFEEAKFMLVACSAFVNYIVAQVSRAPALME